MAAERQAKWAGASQLAQRLFVWPSKQRQAMVWVSFLANSILRRLQTTAPPVWPQLLHAARGAGRLRWFRWWWWWRDVDFGQWGGASRNGIEVTKWWWFSSSTSLGGLGRHRLWWTLTSTLAGPPSIHHFSYSLEPFCSPLWSPLQLNESLSTMRRGRRRRLRNYTRQP